MTDLDDLEARIAENEKHGLYTSPAVKELISELRELRSMRRADNEDIARAYDIGRDKERATVVAYLDENMGLEFCDCCGQRSNEISVIANAIERGEHRREEET